MKNIFVFVLLILTTNSFSQNWVWAKDVLSGQAAGLSDGTASCVDPSGNIYIAGVYADTLVVGTYTFFTAGVASYLIKYDTNGNVLWARSSVGDSEAPYGIASDALGNIYIDRKSTRLNSS